MIPTPSEATMRLVRARARLAALNASVSGIVALDLVRWERIAGRLASAHFDPALAEQILEAEDAHAAEACHLAENVVAAMARLARHLDTPNG